MKININVILDSSFETKRTEGEKWVGERERIRKYRETINRDPRRGEEILRERHTK